MLVLNKSMFHDEVSVLRDISYGFHRAGMYGLSRPELDGALRVLFSPQKDINAPVAVFVHGYRSNPDGPNETKCIDILYNRGFATAQIGFSGYDHYGFDESPKSADKATMPSNIKDLKTVLNFLGRERQIVIAANCAGINVALPAAKENVSHILSLSGFPNSVLLMRTRLRLLKAELPPGSYGIDPDRPKLKVTGDYLAAGQPVDLRREESLKTLHCKPKLVIVRSAEDDILPRGLFLKFLNAAIGAGFSVKDCALPGTSHEPTAEMLEAYEHQVEFIANDLGL